MSKGYLVALNDTSFRLVDKAADVNKPVHNPRYTTFHYQEINKIIVTRKGSAAKGALIGALIGASAGVITGFIMGDDPPCASIPGFYGIDYALCSLYSTTAAEKAAMAGSVCAVGGAIIGVCVGAIAHKKFIITGKKTRYHEMQISVLERLYIAKK